MSALVILFRVTTTSTHRADRLLDRLIIKSVASIQFESMIEVVFEDKSSRAVLLDP